jgi:hypothetical protein
MPETAPSPDLASPAELAPAGGQGCAATDDPE